MFSKLNYKFAFLFFLYSCAKPNYIDRLKQEGLNETTTNQRCPLQLNTENLCVEIIWEKMPTDSEMGSLFLKFYKIDTPEIKATPSVKPNVQLWMPSMGHGSSPTKIENDSEGLFRVTNVFFIMPGQWEIRIQLKDGKNVIDQAIQNITI